MAHIGFAGLGTMGAAMAANLARSEHEVMVWNRTPGRAGPLLDLGAGEVEDPAALAAASDIVVICVSDTPHVEEVLFAARGISAGARPGLLVIDCSTIAPAATRSFAARLAEAGVAFVDAPVTDEGEPIAADSIISLPQANRRCVLPTFDRTPDDAFLRRPQQMRPVMNIEIQAVNRSPYIAILKCPLGAVAEGKYRKTIGTHRGLCGKLIHLVVVHRAGVVF